RQQLGETETLSRVEVLLSDRVVKGIESGYFPAPAGSLVRLFHGLSRADRLTVAMELHGDRALVWNQGEDTGGYGVEYVQRQQTCIGGGTTEMARNIISERILGMPREPAADRDLPFNQVPRSG
ncbi:MAG: acyl-CoA dehydrogenase family protein, partial [bacterium]|nr:acyl-CoA dehydrogenase family protein [bacterium]